MKAKAPAWLKDLMKYLTDKIDGSFTKLGTMIDDIKGRLPGSLG